MKREKECVPDGKGGFEIIYEDVPAVNILGTEYSIEKKTKSDEPRLEDSYGFTDWTTKTIVLDKEFEGANLADLSVFRNKVLRHEIIHAFLCESGLEEMTNIEGAWAMNEEMVDWFARQGPKIYAAWQEAGALP